MEFQENILQAIFQTSVWEWLAVLSGILYVIFISFKRPIAWFFALINSILYIYLCFISQLYIETGLQFFYVIMAIYGWMSWTNKRISAEDKIIRWPIKYHLLNFGISATIALVLGLLFDNFTNQAYPYADAFTGVFSLAATFMVTKKVLENWIYWILIDAICIFLFAARDLYLSAVLFFIYTLIAIFGLLRWKKQFKQQEV
jgi:nicotinamide mononucleotide transporter